MCITSLTSPSNCRKEVLVQRRKAGFREGTGFPKIASGRSGIGTLGWSDGKPFVVHCTFLGPYRAEHREGRLQVLNKSELF